MKAKSLPVVCTLGLALLLTLYSPPGVPIAAIESALDEVRSSAASDGRAPGCPDPAATTRLQAAVANGERIIGHLREDLRRQQEILQRNQRTLEENRQLQAILTSGLVGALVTAIVAIAGAVVSLRNSKPERDFKRLEVIEKALVLRERGVGLPTDLAHYCEKVPPIRQRPG